MKKIFLQKIFFRKNFFLAKKNFFKPCSNQFQPIALKVFWQHAIKKFLWSVRKYAIKKFLWYVQKCAPEKNLGGFWVWRKSPIFGCPKNRRIFGIFGNPKNRQILGSQKIKKIFINFYFLCFLNKYWKQNRICCNFSEKKPKNWEKPGLYMLFILDFSPFFDF